MLSAASRVYEWVDRRAHAAVLTFHRFSTGGLTQSLLREHLVDLSRRHEMVAGSTLADAGVGGHRAVVTVDDGHQDIFEELFPIAHSLRVPFSIFLPTDYYFRQQWLWFDQIDWIRRNCRENSGFTLGDRSYELSVPGDYATIKDKLKHSDVLLRQQLFETMLVQLRLKCPLHPVDGYRAITFEQLREMRASGLVEIGGHTVTHTIATVLGPEAFARELAASKTELESHLGSPVTTFCYPNGLQSDFDPVCGSVLWGAGFKVGMTSMPGLNRPGFDPLVVKRLHSHKTSARFAAEVSGFAAFGRGLVGRKPKATEYASLLLGTLSSAL
ncbi:MAG: polysaccharide deacetylase family protein [Gammaproteobacteria bacterium]|nr:polysaccharide deacetylase family protein [Gammaproteobacteria bacterium]